MGGKMKREYTQAVADFTKVNMSPLFSPFTIGFVWYEPNAKRDPDNVVFAKKFILDGLKVGGIIPDDSQKWVRGFDYERWVVDKEKQGVEITIRRTE